LSFIPIPSNKPLRIADIGCGTGAQTLDLARVIDGQITAVDLFPEFLNILSERAEKEGLSHKIQTLASSMDDLPFETEAFDLIWSEGAVYNMGFENGVKYWKNFLVKGGYFALSELTWTTGHRPAEIQEYWENEYPEVGTASEKIAVLEKHGFSPVGYFYLPESSWIDNYYQPIQEGLDDFLQRNNHSKMAMEIADGDRSEIEKYQNYKDYLSYGFYIARRVE
jgi:cyclopropane fatty-acyl-phospholipid synthase-like methyltransferase